LQITNEHRSKQGFQWESLKYLKIESSY